MAENEITIKCGKIRMMEDGLFHFKGSPGYKKHTLEDSVACIKVCLKLSGGKKYYILVDVTSVESTTKEARDYYSGPDVAPYCSGLAFIVKSPLSRVIANFFMALNKPHYPIKLFTEEKKAIHWLKQLKNV
jgi:hypothetical protein